MREKSYHHGDLQRALIETGIEFIKDEFTVAMQRYVMDLFTAALEKTAADYNDSPSLLLMLGKACVMFFYQNPFYYDFLFSRKNISIKFSLDNADTNENPPLAVLQKTAIPVFRKAKLPEKIIQDKIIAIWALVHGLAAIAAMPNIEFDDNWEERIEEIMKSISIPYQIQEPEK